MEDEGVRVLGVGVGLFLILLIWCVTVAGLALVSRLVSSLSLALVVLAIILTVVLVSVPRYQKVYKEEAGADKAEKILDGMFIWRTVLLVLLSLCALGGGAVTLLDYCLYPVLPSSVKKMKTN